MKKLVLFATLGLVAAEPAKVPMEKVAAHSATVVAAYQSALAAIQAQEVQKQAVEAMNKSLAALRKEYGVDVACRLRIADEGPKAEDKMGTWACPAPQGAAKK